ncbi:MAG TPA: molybdopterin cofactor-binding domain-containing protein [Chthoniobacterales bacterium]|nr:molybdopterin cofactor-binding domain-containing protein [Chthoniobacterales bacterium]
MSRVVTVIDAGRILNPLAGRNQIEGAVVMGIGMALLEHTHYDPQNGAPINSKPGPLHGGSERRRAQARGAFPRLPRQGTQCSRRARHQRDRLAGAAAAITSATHHATDVRVRELPIKLEDLLTSSILA